jgi:hypothetical protein
VFVILFLASFKLIEKVRIGAKTRKKYDKPATPCARLLASDHIGGEQKIRLRAVQESLDPLQLLDEIRLMQSHLARLAAGAPKLDSPPSDTNLEEFLASLATAWEEGEVRPTHRKVYKERYWQTRIDPFQSVWTEVQDYLDKQPDMTAKEIFERLKENHPGEFKPGQLRTLQRRIKSWRSKVARQLLNGEQNELNVES